MTQTQGSHEDVTAQDILTSVLQLAEETPDMMALAVERLEAHLILITEAAQSSGDTALIEAVDGIWEQLQRVKALSTTQVISLTGIGIAFADLMLQRDQAVHMADEAQKWAKQLARLKGA
jgi:hypothetical protein